MESLLGLLFILIPAAIAMVVAYYASKFVREKLLSENNKHAVVISSFIFLGISFLVFGAIIFLILSNIKLER